MDTGAGVKVGAIALLRRYAVQLVLGVTEGKRTSSSTGMKEEEKHERKVTSICASSSTLGAFEGPRSALTGPV